MTSTGEAVAAAAANDVTFAADHLARAKIAHVRADRHDFAHKLVSHHHRDRDRALRPGIPFVDVQVGPADARAVDLDQDIIEPDFRFGDILQPEPRFGAAFDQCFHHATSPSSRFQPRCETATQRVFAMDHRVHKVFQVVAAARFRADTGVSEAAERLTSHEGSGTTAIQIQIAHTELAACPIEVRRSAAIDRSRQFVDAIVRQFQGLVKRGSSQHRQDGAEDLLARSQCWGSTWEKM